MEDITVCRIIRHVSSGVKGQQPWCLVLPYSEDFLIQWIIINDIVSTTIILINCYFIRFVPSLNTLTYAATGSH